VSVQIQGDAVWWICLENEHDDIGYPDRWDSTLECLDGDVGLVKYMAGVKIGLADSRRIGDLWRDRSMPVWE